MSTCSVDKCKNEAVSVCKKHWYQINKYGRPIATRYDPREAITDGETIKIPLYNKGEFKYVKVDENFEYLNDFKWSINSGGYAVAMIDKKPQRMHRLIMGAVDGQYVDHVNGDKLDNRKSNLRFCTVSQNGMNKDKQSNNTSGYKGVYKRGTRWVAKAVNEGVQHHFGTYNTKEEAALAYNNNITRLFGEFARLNEISEGINK